MQFSVSAISSARLRPGISGSRSRISSSRAIGLPILPLLLIGRSRSQSCRTFSGETPMGVVREVPGPGQESVWDYPRPPKLDPVSDHVVVKFGGEVLAETRNAIRVLETSHPPVYYIPPQDVQLSKLTRNSQSSYCEWKDVQLSKPTRNSQSSYCEWKGQAAYYDAPGRPSVAWFYPDPVPSFQAIKDYVAFYPSKVDSCTVDGETIKPQAGDFYGGWITSKVVGPFKGGAGSWGW